LDFSENLVEGSVASSTLSVFCFAFWFVLFWSSHSLEAESNIMVFLSTMWSVSNPQAA
jgi:hypothetical protein